VTPVAVLGASRSGTAIVAQALAAALGVKAAYLPELNAEMEGVLCAPDERCVCPNLNDAAGYLDHLPEAKAVAVWRQPIDFISSRRRAFPEQDFVAHCRLWANAMAAIGGLHARHRGRVAVISYETLLNSRAALGRSMMAMFGQMPAFAETFSGFLAGHQPGRTGLRLGKPVSAVKDAGWSEAEKAVFESICGETLRRLGLGAQLAGAEQAVRLDTGWGFLETARGSGGLVIAPPERRGAAAAVSRGEFQSGALPRLWIQAVAIGGRRRIGLGLSNQGKDVAELYLEVAETLSCRLLLGRHMILEPGAVFTLEGDLAAGDGLVDVILTVISPQNPVAFRIGLDEIVFRQVSPGAENGR
jgi:hypothetical protein